MLGGPVLGGPVLGGLDGTGTRDGGTGSSGEDQVVIGQLEAAGPPGGQGLDRLLLEFSRALRPRHVPHRPPAGGHGGERVGGYQRVRRRSPPGPVQRPGGRGEAVPAGIGGLLGLDQGHVHGPADGGQDRARRRTGQDHHGAGVTSHRLDRSAMVCAPIAVTA